MNQEPSTNFFIRVLRLPLLLHELCHYVPAALFGLTPEIAPTWQKIRYTPTSNARRCVIILAPLTFGILMTSIALGVGWRAAMHENTPQAWLHFVNIVFWSSWCILALHDVARVARFILTKKWS